MPIKPRSTNDEEERRKKREALRQAIEAGNEEAPPVSLATLPEPDPAAPATPPAQPTPATTPVLARANNPYTPNPQANVPQPPQPTALPAQVPASAASPLPADAAATQTALVAQPAAETTTAPAETQPDGSAADGAPPMLALTPRERARRARQTVSDLSAEHVQRTSRWKSALQSGLLGLSKAFNHPIRDENDFLAAAAGAVTYLGAGAIDPKLGPQFVHDLRLERAKADQKDAEDVYGAELKDERSEADLNYADHRVEFQETKAELARQKAENQAIKDQRNAELKIRQMEQKDRLAGNETKIEWDERTGRAMRYFPKDPTRPPEPIDLVDDNGNSVPWINPTHKTYTYTAPSGQEVEVKGSDLLRTDVGIAQANATTLNRAGQSNTDDQNTYQQALVTYENKKADIAARTTAATHLADEAQQMFDELTQQINGAPGRPGTGIATPSQQTQMSALRQKIREHQATALQLQEEYKSLKPPAKPRPFTPQTVPTGAVKFTEAEIRQRGKARGLTPEQIEAKVAEARQKGLLH